MLILIVLTTQLKYGMVCALFKLGKYWLVCPKSNYNDLIYLTRFTFAVM